MEAAKRRGEPLDHTLLYGPPGLGKTTLASIIATEMSVSLRVTSGPAIERAGDLVSILTNLKAGDVLFIDEIHRLNRVVEEVLYPALEDFAVDIIIGKGPAARSMRINLPRFTLVGATTRLAMMTGPLRDRFGSVMRLEFYDVESMQTIINRSALILGVDLSDDGSLAIAKRSRGTPRIANRLLKRVRDVAEVRGAPVIDAALAADALDMLDVDELGLDESRSSHSSHNRRKVRWRAGGGRHDFGGYERRNRHDHGRLRTISDPVGFFAANTPRSRCDPPGVRSPQDRATGDLRREAAAVPVRRSRIRRYADVRFRLRTSARAHRADAAGASRCVAAACPPSSIFQDRALFRRTTA